jgi:hypothetical protein
MSGPWNDFNSAQSNTNVIPKGTLAKVRLTLRPGGFDDPSQGWTGGWARRAATGAVYLDAEYTVLEGPYLRFTNWLTEIDRLSGPVAAIWFEEVRRHAGTDASHIYGGLMATLTAWAELRGVPYEGVPVGMIKRHAAGKGNADKAAMVAAIRARGFSPADDNEADAIAILLWAIETKGGVA